MHLNKLKNCSKSHDHDVRTVYEKNLP